MRITKIVLIGIIASLSATSFAADGALDSKEDRTNLMIEFDKNKDNVLDAKELGEMKTKRMKAHGVLVNYCKLLKSNPEKFQVKAAEIKGADGKAKPGWACNDKRIASAAIKTWIEKRGAAPAAGGSKGTPSRADAIKAIDLNKDKVLDQPEAQKLLAAHPKLHKGLMSFCADVKAAPVKYGLTPKEVTAANGKPQPGWACNTKRVGKAALTKWIATGHKP